MKRLQRLRYSQNIRDLVAETEFSTTQLIQPLFIVEGINADEDILGLKDTKRNTAQSVIKQVAGDLEKGVRHFILFIVPAKKSLKGFELNFAQKVIASLKKEFGSQATFWVDTCLCSLTSHGHCCVLKENGMQSLGETLEALTLLSLRYTEAGADGISPSDMNDGRVAAIRQNLDARGFDTTPIMSYSAKFASQFYGPFRNAADSAPQFGDRSQYQIDVRNKTDAISSSIRCADEGADLLMVKPAMTSLDLIAPIAEKTGLKVGAYQVSGEFASLTALQEKGLLQFDKALLETWHVLKRAGAQYIITYGARYAKNLGVKTP